MIVIETYKMHDISKIETLDDIKELFPRGECDGLNLILFSTSGIHGSYTTIEDIENMFNMNLSESDDDFCNILTVLIIQPRRVNMFYGNIEVNKEDIPYLKKLRESSRKAILWYFETEEEHK